jgi:hypothetical protein
MRVSFTFNLPVPEPLTETSSPVSSVSPFLVTVDQFTHTSPILHRWKKAIIDYFLSSKNSTDEKLSAQNAFKVFMERERES